MKTRNEIIEILKEEQVYGFCSTAEQEGLGAKLADRIYNEPKPQPVSEEEMSGDDVDEAIIDILVEHIGLTDDETLSMHSAERYNTRIWDIAKQLRSIISHQPTAPQIDWDKIGRTLYHNEQYRILRSTIGIEKLMKWIKEQVALQTNSNEKEGGEDE